MIKFDPPPLFQPRVEKKFRPPHLVSQPLHLRKMSTPPPPFGQFEHCYMSQIKHRSHLGFPAPVRRALSPMAVDSTGVASYGALVHVPLQVLEKNNFIVKISIIIKEKHVLHFRLSPDTR